MTTRLLLDGEVERLLSTPHCWYEACILRTCNSYRHDSIYPRSLPPVWALASSPATSRQFWGDHAVPASTTSSHYNQ
jgi:hypothetical protein